MREFIDESIYLTGILIVVTFMWRWLEITMTGKVNPNKVDSVIGFILALSLYRNLKKTKKNL